MMKKMGLSRLLNLEADNAKIVGLQLETEPVVYCSSVVAKLRDGIWRSIGRLFHMQRWNLMIKDLAYYLFLGEEVLKAERFADKR